jgi:DNA polymerase-3 subunit gamma/tau
MQQLPLPRKWRPRKFEDLVGQDAVEQTLRHAIEENRLAHAYLFTGPRGVGKTTTARLLASCLNCVKGPTVTPCGACPSCREIADRGESLDTIELDAASNNSVEDARGLIEILRYAPQRDRYRVLILDEVHMLSKAAFNALLKTIEEPPPHAVFILASTELHKIPATILSRCQRFSFRALSEAEISGRLREVAGREDISVTDGALSAIARASEGSLRDALSLLDQAATLSSGSIDERRCAEIFAFVERPILEELAAAIFAANRSLVLSLVARMRDQGLDPRHAHRELTGYLRERLEASVAGPSVIPYESFLRALSLAIDLERQLPRAMDPWIVWELSLLKMAELPRLRRIEDELAGLPQAAGGVAAPQEVRAHASAPPAGPAPAPASGDPHARFRAIVAARRVTVSSYLALASRVRRDGRRLRIEFSVENASGKEFLDRPDARGELEAAAEEAFGEKLVVEVTVSAMAAPSPPAPPPQKQPQPSAAAGNSKKGQAEEDPLVRKAMDLFRGEVVEVKDGS